jgi:glucuronosyltransferase
MIFTKTFDFSSFIWPTVISIGGAQIQDPKPLPENMKKFIESSKKGTILFSLGTNLKSNVVGKENLNKFLEAFRQMPDYNFLWKNDANDFSDNLPKNVMIQPWVPQTDVFAHPNIKAFMTHSGLLSTQEASWYGIPMITIPFFMDQYRVSIFYISLVY